MDYINLEWLTNATWLSKAYLANMKDFLIVTNQSITSDFQAICKLGTSLG